MKRLCAAAAVLLLLGQSAFAHRIDEYLQATVLSLKADRVDASMRLIPGIVVAPSVIRDIDKNGDGVLSPDEEHAYAERVLDDLSITDAGQPVQPKLTAWSFPDPAEMRAGLGEIHIAYTAALSRGSGGRALVLSNHHSPASSVYLMNAEVPEDRNISIVAQKRNPQQSVYELDYREGGAAALTPWSTLRARVEGLGLGSLFHLGMRHIAEGSDHLLFLLTLLLPAPLVVAGCRWGPAAGARRSLTRILAIVTAFTVGHSLTLTLAALGFVHVPSRPVEALIAASIFVSAIHALRPILPGKEAWIAAFFGLIHGLAFAATLDRLGLSRWDRVAGVLAFNGGIEAMQMLVVAAVLPSLILMSATRVYSTLRIGGALFAAAASLAWMAERTLGIDTGVDRLLATLSQHAVALAAALLCLSMLSRILPGSRPLIAEAEESRFDDEPLASQLRPG